MSIFDWTALRRELEVDEGRRSHPYTDTTGNITIGVGWNLTANGLPEEIIDFLLDRGIYQASRDLDAIEPRWRELDVDKQLVLLNMAFNLGRTRLAGFKRFWEAISDYLEGDSVEALDRAAEMMLDSLWSRQVGQRAVRLADRMKATK